MNYKYKEDILELVKEDAYLYCTILKFLETTNLEAVLHIANLVAEDQSSKRTDYDDGYDAGYEDGLNNSSKYDEGYDDGYDDCKKEVGCTCSAGGNSHSQ